MQQESQPCEPFENEVMWEIMWLGAKASKHGRRTEGPLRGRNRENMSRNTANSENSKFGEISPRDVTNVLFKEIRSGAAGCRFS